MVAFLLVSCIPGFPQSDFPPTITILAPGEAYLNQSENPYSVGSFIPFEFLISDPDTQLNSIEVKLNSNIDGLLYQGGPDADGYLSVLLASLSAGEHQLSVSAEDEQNYVSQIFGIGLNTPPSSTCHHPVARTSDHGG